MISSFETSSDGLRIYECEAGRRQTAWLLADSHASVGMGRSDAVLRVGLDRQEGRRTGQRLLLKEGARNRPEGPEDPLGTSSGGCVLPA